MVWLPDLTLRLRCRQTICCLGLAVMWMITPMVFHTCFIFMWFSQKTDCLRFCDDCATICGGTVYQKVYRRAAKCSAGAFWRVFYTLSFPCLISLVLDRFTTFLFALCPHLSLSEYTKKAKKRFFLFQGHNDIFLNPGMIFTNVKTKSKDIFSIR